MSVLDFIFEHWIAFTVSGFIAFSFAIIQYNYFKKNKKKLFALKSFFLNEKTDYSVCKIDEVAQIVMIKEDNYQPLNKLIKEINLYVQKSVGTADFNIIQNKTERCIDSLFEHATGELSFPTYYGLMGTFAGTFLGLIGFLFGGSDLSDESKVTNLIIGVLVSMITSWFGLLLTTLSNHKAAETKKQLDRQKNEFLDFIQLELIPKLHTTITTLQQTMEGFVPKFDLVINNFERTFSSVIGRFKDTFDQCTDNFGTEFRQNSSYISKTVSALNQSIGKITENVENQRQLLVELKSEKMFDTLQDFVDATKSFELSTGAINEYTIMLQDFIKASQNVIDKQTEYANSLHIPHELAVKLTALLNRISTFEQNINALGENLGQAEMLGNQELALIKRHLESLEEKKQLADRFLDTSNEELESVFKLQTKTIKSLFDHYQQQLEDERDALSAMVREILQIINKKKTDLLNHLDNAFDVSKVHTMFSHLKTLPDIATKLEEMESMIVSTEQLGQYVQELINRMNQMQTAIQNLTSEQIQAINDRGDKLSSTMVDIGMRQNDNNDVWMKKFEGIALSTKSDLEKTFDASKVQMMFSHLKTLPDIATKLEDMESIIVSTEQLKQYTEELINGINQLQSAIHNLSSEQIQAINDEGDKLSSTIIDIGSQQNSNYDAWMNKLEEIALSSKSELNVLKDTLQSDIQIVPSHVDKQMQMITSELKSNILQISEGTRHLRRDITKDVSAEVVSEVNKININIREQGKNTDKLIRSTGEQTISLIRQLSAEKKTELSAVIKSLEDKGQNLQVIIDALKQQKNS